MLAASNCRMVSTSAGSSSGSDGRSVPDTTVVAALPRPASRGRSITCITAHPSAAVPSRSGIAPRTTRVNSSTSAASVATSGCSAPGSRPRTASTTPPRPVARLMSFPARCGLDALPVARVGRRGQLGDAASASAREHRALGRELECRTSSSSPPVIHRAQSTRWGPRSSKRVVVHLDGAQLRRRYASSSARSTSIVPDDVRPRRARRRGRSDG